jgi:hypothetical protein
MCLQHKLGILLVRESNHGYGEIVTRDHAIAQEDEDGEFCLYR